MAIEFRCTKCGRLLRTPDDAAGKQAQCPECGTLSTVPTPASGAASSPSPSQSPLGGAPPPAEFDRGASPYQSTTQPGAPFGMDPVARQRVSGPSIALIVVGILGIIAIPVPLIIDWRPLQVNLPFVIGPGVNAASTLVSLALLGLVIWGAIKMGRLENYGLSMAAAIIALVPCTSPCCCLGLPFGIWALVVLSDPRVKAAFRS